MSKSDDGSVGGEEAGKEKEKSSDKDHSSKPKRYLAQVAALVASIINCARPKREQNDADKEWDRKWRKLEVWGIWAAASVGLVAVVWSGFDTHKQIAEMRAEQRPWVYATDISPAGRIVLDRGMYAVPIVFSIKNTGHLPAFFVEPKSSAAVIAIGEATKTIRNDVCDDYENTPATANGGQTVFADQIVSHGGFTSDDYPAISKEEWDAKSGGKMLVIFGCVDYQFPDQPGHHQSRFAFAVGQAKDQGVLKRIGSLPDDPTTVDIRFLPVNIGDDKPPN